MPKMLSMFIIRERDLNNQSIFKTNNKYKNQDKKFLLTASLSNFVLDFVCYIFFHEYYETYLLERRKAKNRQIH